MRRDLKMAGLLVLAVLTVLAGCTQESGEPKAETDSKEVVASVAPTKVLSVKWQRLVDTSGQTCSRCGLTGTEVRKSIDLLTSALQPLAIDVVLDEKSLSPTECAADISQSNRIWIGGVSLEEWLNARVGESPCEGCCDYMKGCLETDRQTVDCRTVVIGNRVYEAIPSELILKAGLLAAAEMILPVQGSSCCPGGACSKPCGGIFTR